MRILYQILKFFPISHSISLAVAAYLIYYANIKFTLPLVFAVPFSIVLSIFLMILIDKFVYKPLQKRNLEGWQMLIASLGVYIVFQNVISIFWGDGTLSFRTWPVKAGHQFLGAYITNVQIITILIGTGLMLISWLFLERTNVGQQIKAATSNPELSGLLGIDRNKAVVWSFILGSGLAACAGILIAADTDMTPTMGFNWLLYAMVAMIVGGMGKMRYLLLGSLFLATAQHLSAYYLDNKWMNATAFVILIVFLYFKPYGFSGQKPKKTEI